jgi:glycosyltransferase involved in cell wall biosynthesis
MKNILFIHQSAELYGSDKTLLVLVVDFKKRGINPIVIIPEFGPLHDCLLHEEIHTLVLPVLKVSRKMFSIKGVLAFPFQIRKAIKGLDSALKGMQIDLVYSNTLAVLLGFFYAQKSKCKHIWHIHEIIRNPKLVKNIFSLLIQSKTNRKIIYNSIATQQFWEKNKTPTNHIVVWNGLKKPEQNLWTETELNLFRQQTFNAQADDIIIGLVGRINKWKGQRLLLEAFAQVATKHPNIKLVYVGSCPPNQEAYLAALETQINAHKLHDRVFILPFQTNIWQIWQTIDLAVIPSIEPEPFGLVAIEAMLSQKPVIAAAHGGLVEIIDDGVSGILFEPNNQTQLVNALENLIEDKALRIQFGLAGLQKAQEQFTEEKYVRNIENICLSL